MTKSKNVYLLQVLLSANGFELEIASNGAEALELARRAPPDMVVSDILMPVMDGFALCRAWKADERLKDIPFVFYTATYTDPKDEAFALSLGADRFIVKPAEPDKFLALLQETIRINTTSKPAAPHEPMLDETEYYKEYNATLIRKLEDKVLQLEQANSALELDIAERKQAEEALRESQKRVALLASLLERSSQPFAQAYPDGHVGLFNAAFLDLIGYTHEEFSLLDWVRDLTPPEWLESEQAKLDELNRTNKPVRYEKEYIRKDGSRVPIELLVHLIRDENGQLAYYYGFITEITERVRAEETIKASLAEKEVLLKEIHHRVKNNLAVISALLELQARASQDDSLKTAFKDSQQRIQAMAAIHEQLYRSQNLSQIDMLKYVEALAEGLLASDILSDVKISVAVQDVTLDIDHAIPCGLIINELVTNAMKYAFKNIRNADKQERKITICLNQEKEAYVLKVSDNGVGLPDSLDVKHTKTLGLKLVNRLIGQLEGTLDVESSQVGAIFIITFPVPA